MVSSLAEPMFVFLIWVCLPSLDTAQINLFSYEPNRETLVQISHERFILASNSQQEHGPTRLAHRFPDFTHQSRCIYSVRTENSPVRTNIPVTKSPKARDSIPWGRCQTKQARFTHAMIAFGLISPVSTRPAVETGIRKQEPRSLSVSIPYAS
jgi:hypothetical protein